MNGFLFILLILTMLAVLGVLGMGLVAMARGGEFNARHGQRLMRWRVWLQGTAVVLFILLLLTAGGS